VLLTDTRTFGFDRNSLTKQLFRS